MLRVVLDTSVLVSALVGTGRPRELWRAALEGRFVPVISKEMLAEFLGVVDRKRFEDVGRRKVERFARQLIRISAVTSIRSSYRVVEEDPDDDVVINTAYSGRAKYIVTGDSHLLTIGRFKNIEIVSIGSLLQLL